MVATDAAGEQIPREPAAFVFEVGLVSESRRCIRLAEIVGLNERGVGIDRTNRAHREDDAAALIQQSPTKGEAVAAVRVPVAVKTAESRGRERLIYGSESVDPGIALRHARGIRGQLFRELRIDKA